MWNSVAALRNAQEVASQHPSLGVVAGIAALATLCTCERCVGKVRCNRCGGSLACSKCGRTDFPHDIAGECKLIEDLVLRSSLNVKETVRQRLRDIVRSAYGEVRSGFVHSAMPGDPGDTVGEPKRMTLQRPNRSADMFTELRRSNVFSSFVSIARRAVVFELARRSRYPLDSGLWGFDEAPCTQVLSTCGIRLAGTSHGVLQVGKGLPEETPDRST